MLLLLGIGFVAGVVTAISPCVLPVLPILLAGGAAGRKPLRIVAGLVASFSVFTLFAAWILGELGLPQDLLRNLAIAFLFVLAATLLVPRAALLIERPLAAFSRFRPGNVGGGFFFGATLGLVFVPCAGPVLATVTVIAANNSVGLRAILLTLAYAAGAAVPMLLIAYGGREASTRLRRHAQPVRLASGALIALVALGLVFHLDDHLAQLTPGYTTFLQNKIENNTSAKRELSKVRGGGQTLAVVHKTAGGLPDYGTAPALVAGGDWFNSKPLSLAQLRGKVVLVDFWTYSCINCLRTLPAVRAWARTYASQGLVVVGVHAPEFEFEHDPQRVRQALVDQHVDWPVAIDDDFRIWRAFRNEAWPALYFIDAQGRVRHHVLGEGGYDRSERVIRQLLAEAHGAAAPLPAMAAVDATGIGAAPDLAHVRSGETYLGYAHADTATPPDVLPERAQQHVARAPRLNAWTLGDAWVQRGEFVESTAPDASIALRFHARDLHLVLGPGTDGKPVPFRITIDGHAPAADHGVDVDEQGRGAIKHARLYQLVRQHGDVADHTFEIHLDGAGARAWVFTFG